ncbi:helix-turn-helix domain-containing protein [Sphaerimonospora mesophila]|uniref:helix-turn-helix domain-containing protein n=1 Tax=Sphaerimonospora mesophila TaxID=37483 RepID=UPI0006E39233
MPSATALDQAEKASRRARRRAQLRLSFIARPDAETSSSEAPPLARMLRGGRGGQVRLKLFLSYLWMQTSDQATPLAHPAQAWAQLLDLPQAATTGARRINEAQAWLERHGFITVKAHPGHANAVTVLNETGDGSPYVAPGAAAKAHRNTPEGLRHLYVQLPATLWTNGYIQLMTGAGLAMYLILLDQYWPTELTEPLHHVWISPKAFAERYDLSTDTRTKGINDLRDLGLLTFSRKPINPDDFDIERLRNVYTLHPGQLDKPAHRRPQHTKTIPTRELKPDPLTASTPEELVDQMRRYRIWAGDPSYRELVRRSGGTLSLTRLHRTFTQSILPRSEVLQAFIRACGGSGDDVERWATAWRQLRIQQVRD